MASDVSTTGSVSGKCFVNLGGYEWVRRRLVLDDLNNRATRRAAWDLLDNRAARRVTWVLVPRDQAAGERSYEPMKEPTLFRDFSGRDPSNRADLVAFADRYGPLGVAEGTLSTDPRQTWDTGTGEPLGEWQGQLCTMKAAIWLWELLREDDVAELRRHLQRSGPDAWKIDLLPVVPVGFRSRVWPQAAHPCQDVKAAARHLVEEWVNRCMGDAGEFRPRVVLSAPDEPASLEFVSNTLLGSLWIQVATSIDRIKQQKPCRAGCGKWIEISASKTGRTARAEFCSVACKSADYRRRRERAEALAEAGTPARLIAKETGTDERTVRGWIKARKRADHGRTG